MNQCKAVIMGEGGVGKSTLVALLQGKQIPMTRNPTIGVNVEKVQFEDKQLEVWDFAGQHRFQFMWQDFMKGSSLTLVVTDSSPRNVMETKEILSRYDRSLGAEVIAIANKQDLEGRLTPSEIESILGVPTYGMIATNQMNQDALQSIISSRLSR